MATIAELQIGLSTNAQINPMEIQDFFHWKHEYFFFRMGRHKQHTDYDFPGESILAPDPEYLPKILPDAITLFHCSNGLLSGFFKPVSIHTPTGNNTNIVAMPNDTLHKNRVEELHISADMLSPISDQWLIELEISAAPSPNKVRFHGTRFHVKTSFAVLSNAGAILMSTMQSRLFYIHSDLVNTQVMGQMFFHLLDIVDMKMNHPTAKWFVI